MSDDGKNSYPKKKYNQHYRKKWEEIPQLRGWLSMFPHKNPEKTKAFCKYCQRKLVPHVTGLLKHAACRAHLKHARAYMERVREVVKKAEEKAKLQKEQKQTDCTNNTTTGSTSAKDKSEVQIDDDELNGKITLIVKNTEHDDDEPEIISGKFADNDDCVYSDEDDVQGTVIADPLSQQVKIRVVVDDAMMSTHVLDTTRGMPVIGLGVSLYRLQDGRWTILSDSVTDAEGRCTDLLKDNSIAMQAGRYKMHYDVSQYYAIRNQECFFPFVEVVFDISNPTEKYHIPLLLSPFSYSTYRGC